jgi:putative peptide zinc metalloprotease protein
MSANEKIFHESWYQIANQRIFLRASVKVVRQMFRGRQWYVLHDPFTNQFFRLRSQAYDFVARMGMHKTVEEAWNWMLEHAPENAPSQSEIVDLLAQLYHANLLHYEIAPNSVKLFERFRKRRNNLARSTVLNLMFARIPLWDPHYLLNRLQPLINLMISPAGLVVWLVMIGLGIKTAIDNLSGLKDQSDGILAPENIALLYAGVVLIKVIHEFGHAFAVRRFGGEVHALGVMLMMFTPLPYTDATAAWAFRDKWARIFVGAAGMVFELFVAAIAILVWANTGEGVVHSLAYNMIFTASVSTVLFNINPLLRYDGYYMLADFLDIPNLQQQATKQLTYALERFGFGKKDAESPAQTRSEGWTLGSYAVLSSVYRIFVFSGILLFVGQKMLLLAFVMGVFFLASWLVMPLYKFVKYIATGPSLARVRARAVRTTLLAVVILFALLDFVPFPYGFKAPGILKAVDHIAAVNPTAGRVTALGKASGSTVQAGDTLLTLENLELSHQRAETEAELRESESALASAVTNSQADIEPIKKRVDAYGEKLIRIDRQIADLQVRAPIAGIWIAPDVDDFPGRWLPRGTPLGQLINPTRFYFATVVSQRDISELFGRGPCPAQLRLAGQADHVLRIPAYNVIPMEQNQLPSMALGFMGGGDIGVNMSDSSGTRTLEPFYEVRAEVEPEKNVALLHGRRGQVRFALGYKPLLWQGWRKLRQMIQKHYQV